MDEEDDDIYNPDNLLPGMGGSGTPATAASQPTGVSVKQELSNGGGDGMDQDNNDNDDDDDDDDEDEDEDDSDDDIQVITHRAPGDPAPEPLLGLSSRINAAVKIEAPSGSTPVNAAGSAPLTTTTASSSTLPHGLDVSRPASRPLGRASSSTPAALAAAVGRPGSSYPEVKTSTLDLDANPVLSATGKPVFSTDMDADFAASSSSTTGGATGAAVVTDTAPWRRPGTDMTDYYNYGFDEGTWAAYCIKQRSLRGEMAEDRRMMEQLQAMMGGGVAGGSSGSMPGGMAGPTGGAGQGMPGYNMPGMDMMGGMSADQMQQMMSMFSGGMPGMPNMDNNMPQQGSQQGFGNQGFGGWNQGGRGKRW